jgi:beta-fructofuranosidase
MTSALAFHAAAPTEWINDPNGLWRTEDGWTLLVQHRADRPDWQRTGWGRFTSPNLLDWTWQGPSIQPDPDTWAYSGCVRRTPDGLLALHTEHAPGPPASERQVLRQGGPDGAHWGLPRTLSIPPLAARRDPFLFRHGRAHGMLLARPCPWTGWEAEPPSHIEMWESADLVDWRLRGTVGPWDPPGLLWEVPVLLPGGPGDGEATLLVSRVDRRSGRARSDSRWWRGRLADDVFAPTADGPLDLGPDFYAATVATDDPGLLVGWLSSWDTARAMPWPGFAGGPISLPRRLTVDGGRVHVAVEPAVRAAFRRPVVAVPPAGCGVATIAGDSDFRLVIEGSGCRLAVTGDGRAGTVRVQREALPPFDWTALHADVLRHLPARTLRLFLDGPVVELFVEPDGLALSAALPTTGPLSVGLSGSDFAWFER